jgi:Mg2+-importing ATPase
MRRLGVAIKVLSGDGAAVTRRICREVGLEIPEERVVTGEELDGLDAAGLAAAASRYGAFARVSPDQKRRLVDSLNVEGHTVGFLGDGINDAPALRAADVGISVDTAASVAREAADVILLQKDLGVLARGIVEGRKTFANITKYIFNTVSANFGNMLTVAVSSLFLRFIPLLPSQILLNNFLSDAPLLAIATDRVDAELLRRPRRWDISLISRFMVWFGLLSVVFDLLLLGVLQVMGASAELFRTAWFVESACSEMVVTFAIRSRAPFYRSLPSLWLVAISFFGIATAFALPRTVPGQRLFELVPLPAEVLGLVGGILFVYFLAAEALKVLFFRGGRS